MQKINFKEYKLKTGAHESVEQGLCAMEMVAYLAKEPHSDRPKCACPALTSFVLKLNDKFSNSERQRLKPFLKKIIGTRDSDTLNRAKHLAHAALTIFAPLALDVGRFKEHAEKLRAVEFGDWKNGGKLAANAANAANAAYAAYAATRKPAVDAVIEVLADCLKKFPAKKKAKV